MKPAAVIGSGAGCLGVLLLLSGAPVHGDATPLPGTVTGSVRLEVSPPAPPTVLSPYARPRYRPPARPETSAASPETVVIWLRGTQAPSEAPPASAEVIQRGRTIIPHVTVIRAGARVDFPNEDDVFHNLFSLSAPHRFNLGRYPPGDSQSEVFEKPGVIRLFCDIHSEMAGVILVLDTPFFTKPDADGAYRIAGVPPGEYTAIAWHELAATDSARVVVGSGTETRLDFLLRR